MAFWLCSSSSEPFLGGAARESTNFFAVRRNVFAHFLLRVSTEGARGNAQRCSPLLVVALKKRTWAVRRARGQVLGDEGREKGKRDVRQRRRWQVS